MLIVILGNVDMEESIQKHFGAESRPSLRSEAFGISTFSRVNDYAESFSYQWKLDDLQFDRLR